MATIFLIVYFVFYLLTFVFSEHLNRSAVFYTTLVVSLFYFGLAFYTYSLNREHYGFTFFLTWWTYFILTHRIIRRQFVKENQNEPVVTWGSNFDFKTRRKAHFGDFLYTLMLLVIPAFLGYLTAIIAKAIGQYGFTK